VNEVDSAASLGKALQQARYAAGLTQRDLARRLGISQLYVTEMEAGKPSLFTTRLFAYLREVGATLSFDAPPPGDTHGYRAVWPRPARPADIPALHELDRSVTPEQIGDWIADPGTTITTIAGAVDWPSGTHMQARYAFADDAPLLGYAVNGRVTVRPEFVGTEVEALLLGQVR